MKRPKVTPGGIRLVLNGAEADVLTDLAAQLAELLGSADDQVGDAALERLLPDGYRDSPENADEFRRFTQTELVDDKLAGSATIRASLASRTESGDAVVTLSPPDAVAWLRSINDIRLALAARLGIVDDTYKPDYTDNDYGIYVWLGQLQYLLLRAVDR